MVAALAVVAFVAVLAVAALVAAALVVAVLVVAAFLAAGFVALVAGLAAAFLAEAVVVLRVAVAATARLAVAVSRVTVMPCSSSERSTAFIRLGATSAPSSAARSWVLSTEPLVRPCLSSVCRAGWLNSWGSEEAAPSGLEAFFDTGDTDDLSSRTRGTAHAIAGTRSMP